MAITAAMVKQLREQTGVGMMDCKRALENSHGNMEKAIEAMRKSGLAKAAKKAGRIAAEGLVLVKQNEALGRAVIAEVNTETDFAAKEESFKNFCSVIADCILTEQPADLKALATINIETLRQTVEEARQQLILKIGENINIRRFTLVEPETRKLGIYLHGTRIGVLVELEGGDEAIAKDIAMHIAASNPVCIAQHDVPKDILQKEREILTAQAKEQAKKSGKFKPPEIIEKIVNGRIKKYLDQITLLGQPFVKEPDQSMADLFNNKGVVVTNFVRYEVGEGLVKRDDNFVGDVMAQVEQN